MENVIPSELLTGCPLQLHGRSFPFIVLCTPPPFPSFSFVERFFFQSREFINPRHTLMVFPSPQHFGPPFFPPLVNGTTSSLTLRFFLFLPTGHSLFLEDFPLFFSSPLFSSSLPFFRQVEPLLRSVLPF